MGGEIGDEGLDGLVGGGGDELGGVRKGGERVRQLQKEHKNESTDVMHGVREQLVREGERDEGREGCLNVDDDSLLLEPLLRVDADDASDGDLSDPEDINLSLLDESVSPPNLEFDPSSCEDLSHCDLDADPSRS